MKITKIFKRIKCEIMYRQATAKADYAAKKNKGEIYFVLPTARAREESAAASASSYDGRG